MYKKSIKLQHGSPEGLRAGRSTPIVMNGTGYLNPKNWRSHTIAPMWKPNTVRHMGTPNKIDGIITDYSKVAKFSRTLDAKLHKLF